MIDTPQHQHRRRASSGPRPFSQTSKANAHTVPTARGKMPILTPAERAARNQPRESNVIAFPVDEQNSYAGTELLQNPGIPAARFAAYTLPSRSGDWLYYPDGQVMPFPSSAADQATQAAIKAGEPLPKP
ncbi:hypothetical protein HNP33_002525 [Comamonas odontotermitis]|uniref:Uncharacterized protein n=1 Tax=Comamonas odontotermitis TaxID=379895 RepID=A0ABR6RH86_9BURK|nr:hypothetical protein [Comamonas odontotermitis]